MQRFAVIVVLAVVAVSCSSGDSDGGATTTTTVAGASGSTSSTSPPSDSTSTTGVPDTTPPAGGGGIDDCIVGSWDLDSQPFFDTISESLGGAEAAGEFRHVGGVYRITASADGTFVDQRIDWTFAVVTDEGGLELSINHTQTGTYTVEDGIITTSIPAGGGAPEVTMSIDGVPSNIPGGAIPIDPPDASFDSAVATCDDDTLVISYDGFTSTWNRSA